MKVVFMGTPDFAVPCLRALCEGGYDVAAVFTQPDKPKNRGHKLLPTPVKSEALSRNIPVYQPLSLRNGDDAEQAFDVLTEIAPDVIVVVAYGQILPQRILSLPVKYGCINIHASLLPKYRGAAPIQHALLNGDAESGVTSMQMEKGLDTGDILVPRSISVGRDESFAELHDRLSALGAEVLLETLSLAQNNALNPVKQDDSLSCYAGMITGGMHVMDFEKSASELHNLVRAIGGVAYIRDKRIKIYKTSLCVFDGAQYLPGEIADAKKLIVACGGSTLLRIDELQSEGGKRLATASFLCGFKICRGDVIMASPTE